MRLTTAQLDRACGVLLATAAGDALGAGYEFGPPLAPGAPVAVKGGGNFDWAPGEWTDDTSMALVIAETAAAHADLRGVAARDAIVARWADWASDARDVGIGNGSLMRTAPVALAYLDDPDGLTQAATAISALTHYDREAGEACVLWCHAIRHAILTGTLDAHFGLQFLPPSSRAGWADRLTKAERSHPSDFTHNGWVVQALQAAWCAIVTTEVPRDNPAAGSFRAGHLQLALKEAVRGGRDADTGAAIPRPVYGDGHRPPVTEPHPDDPGLLLADAFAVIHGASWSPRALRW